MRESAPARVAIVDYGLGNLYSVKNACRQVDLDAEISSSADVLLRADGVVLPGIGAFGHAMATLRRLDLVEPLKDVAASGKPVMGVCLGLQLLMRESYEFGTHKGLGLIEGTVEPLGQPEQYGSRLKVPHVGWTRVHAAARPWSDTGLDGVSVDSYMYFVHSYCVKPVDATVVLSVSHYGDVTFCSSVQVGALFACQFHPERSGRLGLTMYRNLQRAVARTAARLSA
jgi:glutamine amidotransferase